MPGRDLIFTLSLVHSVDSVKSAGGLELGAGSSSSTTLARSPQQGAVDFTDVSNSMEFDFMVPNNEFTLSFLRQHCFT